MARKERYKAASDRVARVRKILVVVGGRRTERQYLDQFRAAYGGSLIQLRFAAKTTSPSQIVAYANRIVREEKWGFFDEVWCVFDVDEFVDVAAACTAARRSGIEVAVSNPCFELWLLLHFCEHRSHLAGYKEVARLLQKHIRNYDKSRLNFVQLSVGVDDACRRAQMLDPTGEAVHINPSTGVWRLVGQIRSHPSK